MVEHLGFSGFGLGDQGLVQDVQNILAHLLQLGLDLLAVIADGSHMLFRSLGLLFLLNRRNDAPRGTTGADNVLVCDGKEISLVNGKFTSDLYVISLARCEIDDSFGDVSYLCDFL